MLKNFKQAMDQKYCLECKGCCRFKEAKSPWRPKVYTSEDKILRHKALEKTFLDSQGHVATRASAEEHVCLFLDSLTNACQVYQARPFECELYPFLFIKNQEGVFLAVHLACPFVQEAQSLASFQEYCGSLREFFRQEGWQTFLKEHINEISSSHIHDNEIQPLFCIFP